MKSERARRIPLAFFLGIDLEVSEKVRPCKEN